MSETPSTSQQAGGAFRETDADLGDGASFEVVAQRGAFHNLLQYKRYIRITESTDLDEFLEDASRLLNSEFVHVIRMHRCVRVSLCVHALYEKINASPDVAPTDGYLRTPMMAIISEFAIRNVTQQLLSTIRLRHANFMRDSSGLRLSKVVNLDTYITKFSPLSHVGHGFANLPPFLVNKKAIVNVQNKDNRCFGYAVLSALYPVAKNTERPKNYEKYFDDRPHLANINYPVEIEELERVEAMINVPLNVYSFFDDEGRGRYPVYLSKLDQDAAIDLLFWEGHFAWIKNFSRFLGDTNTNEHERHYCKRCLGHFVTERTLQNHQLFCQSIDNCKQVYTMPPEGAKLRFYNVRYQQLYPFAIYADFESLTVPCVETKSAKKRAGIPIHTYQTHKPISVGLKLVSSVPDVLNLPFETYTGDDVAEWFLRRLLEYRIACNDYLFNEQRLIMTDADKTDFEQATVCYICEKAFPDANKKKKLSKVRDHDHITGKYRGPAHSACNLKLRTTYKLPIFLHNFRNYDGHLIVPAFTVFKETKLSVIGQGLEKYLSVTWDDTLVFKDSLQFLSGSLEALVDCLRKGGKDKFIHLREGFLPSVTDEEGLELIIRKGVYPYD